MPSLVLLAVLFLVAYLIGAIPFGYLIARARGVDLFAVGSGNIGATNVGRVLGRTFGILVFVLDFAKGAVPVLLTRWLVGHPADLPAESTTVTAGVAAFLGHLFPVYLKFRGGKGVATAAGVLFVLVPGPFLLAAVLWLALFASSRTVSLASLVAAGFIGAHRLVAVPAPFAGVNVVVTVFCLLAALAVVLRHHANVRRLLSGTETAFPESPTMTHLGKLLHVFSVALWFGTIVCFTAVGYFLFGTLERLSEKPEPQRPYFFPMPEHLKNKAPLSPRFPDPLSKEQGSLIAGEIVSPMFPWFFGTQVVCGVVALLTALAWRSSQAGQVRIVVAIVALSLAVAGWGLEVQVSELRKPRNEATHLVLGAEKPTKPMIEEAEARRAAFGMWHGISMLVNLMTLVLVVPLVGLCAALPATPTAPATPTTTIASLPDAVEDDNGEQTVVMRPGEETTR